MKKILLLCLFIILTFTGCMSKKEEPAPVISQSQSVETAVVQPIRKATYKPADHIVSMKSRDAKNADMTDDNTYLFGGFKDEDTFAIVAIMDKPWNNATSQEFYYTFKKDTIITIPFTDLRLKVVDFDVQENIITFEQLAQ